MELFVHSYGMLRKYALWDKDIRIINDEFNTQKQSYLEYLWTTWLKDTKYPQLQTGYHSGNQIPRFQNSIPDAWFKTDSGFHLFWFMGCQV